MTKLYEAKNAAVVLSEVSKSYRVGSITTPVLRGIDLAISREGLSVLCGPSGSGKTTLLNLIGCIDRPDHGSLKVLDTDVASLTDNELSDFRRQNIGYIFQNFNLLPVLTAYENVEYPLQLAGLSTTERKSLTELALNQVGLSEHAQKYPSQLSGGQRQRVAIARALVKRPSLVLADEPTANLDSETGESIITLIKQLQAQHHIAFVISSHDQLVRQHADRVYVMRDGQLVAEQEARLAQFA